MKKPSSAFSAWVPIQKAYQGKEGEWIFEGPLTEPGPDIEGDRIDPTGMLEKGMSLFDKFGGPVDWDHQYPETHDPYWLVGKGIERFKAPHPSSGVDVPWMRTRLYKGKKIAQNAVEHWENGGGLGYSIWGHVETVNPDGSKVPSVAMVSITPVPVATANAGTLALAKSLAGQGELPLVPETREQVLAALAGVRVADALERIAKALENGDLKQVAKALEATAALPPGGPGIDAARTEDIGGDPSPKKKGKRKARTSGAELRDCIHKALQMASAERVLMRLGGL